MGLVSGSTKRPDARAGEDPPAREQAGSASRAAQRSKDPGTPDPKPPPSSASLRASERFSSRGRIDLRARAAAARGPAQASSSASHSAAGLTGPHRLGTPWSQLVDSLCGDVILARAAGRRVLDLGHGSPELSEWVRRRAGAELEIVDKTSLDQGPRKIVEHSGFLPASEFLEAKAQLPRVGGGEPALRLGGRRDASFDLVYSLRTFPHLGFDTDSSERLAAGLLREAARVTADGGTVFVQIANPRSLRGLIEGIRNPITVVSRRRMILGDRYGLTRWDTLPRFLRFLPRELEFVRAYGLGVLIPHSATLQLPLVGRVLTRLEWWLRDLSVVNRFGAQLLLELRRLHRSDPSLQADGPKRATLSSSLIEALSSGTRSLGRAFESSASAAAPKHKPASSRDGGPPMATNDQAASEAPASEPADDPAPASETVATDEPPPASETAAADEPPGRAPAPSSADDSPQTSDDSSSTASGGGAPASHPPASDDAPP